jgi:thiaminase/transcriptional activator TenA
MREAAETRSYAGALSVLVVAEWLYLDWGLPRAAAAAGQLCPRRVDHTARQSRFSRLRRFPAYGIGPGRPRTGLCRDFFRRAVALELSFFEAAYAERT